MNNIIKKTWNRAGLVETDNLSGSAFRAEEKGHTFRISGEEDGQAVSLSGTVTATFIKPDNTDVTISGSASGGIVSVTLTDACYTVRGRFRLTVFLTSGGEKTAIYSAVGAIA